MTPQEKAQELWSKYRPIIAGKQVVTGVVLMYEANELTKQCALIAVDEILNNDGFTRFDIYLTEYWQEVKHEITQL